mgnify:CR=1 FL=1
MSEYRHSILIVDDEPALLDLTTEILESHGYLVYRAESAKEALELLKKQSVDLLISDVVMPGMNGYQLAAEVSKLYPAIKIQMVSGFTNDYYDTIENNEWHLLRLEKPLNMNMLLKKIRDIFSATELDKTISM